MMFAHRQLLWLLLVIPPAMGVFFWWARRKREALRQQFIQARLLPSLTVGISPTRQAIRHGCLIAAAIGIILALARPQWGYDFEEAHQRGLDIVVAVDTSKSMLADDIAPNRLARAKLAALDLMRQAKSDRLGLVAFAGSAFLQCPLTIDDSAFRQSVETLDVNLIPQGGTAIADAIKTALTAFKETDNYKVLVLFTDGEDQDSGALDEAKKAAEAGLQIFTIGVGSVDGELLRITDAKGRTDYIRDDQGNVVKSRLNESLLREIAGAAKGFYLPLRGATTIEDLYEKGLAPLPKSESGEKLIKTPHERYQWPLGFAIIVLIAEAFFPERRRQPRANAVGSLSGKTAFAAAISTMLLLLPAAHASPSSALREYNAGKYDKAFEEYQQLLKAQKPDPRLHFNAGAAAYRQDKFEEAAKQFEESMAASSDLNLQEQAYYNRGNAFFHFGEGLPDPAKRTEAWKKSLQDFESTLKLNPQDADAKYNAAFVKKKLEDLQQQQQQNQQNKNDQQNQDQKDQQKNDQSKKDQEQKNQQQQNQQNQQNQEKQQQQQDQQKQDQQKQQQASKPEEKKDEKQANQSAGKPGEKSDEKPDSQQAYAAGQMTPEDAQRLLDSQKGDERMLPVSPEGKPSDQTRHIRDW